jgi:uncharacterized membrane protein YphA (DoxX/SURF4 family)
MNPLRFLGRTLLASYFVGHGVSALRHPDDSVQDAEPVVDKVTSFVDRVCPPSLRRFVPDSPKTFVRLHGIVEIVGGLLMATGLARRFGALLLIKGQLFRIAAGNPKEGSADDGPISPELGRDIALLGACVIEALDTQGRPSLVYRARQSRRRATVRAKAARAGSVQATGQVVAQVAAKTKRAKRTAKLAAKVAAREAKAAQRNASQQAKIARQAAQLKVVEVQRRVAEAFD